MKTIVCEKPGSLLSRESAYPAYQKGYSVVRVRKIGICGTDLHAYEGTQPYFTYPRVLGHEIAAEYVEGDAAGFSAGDHCTFIPYISCGICVACRNGKTNCCSDLKVCGVHIDGAMCEFYGVPSDLLLHADGLSDDELALVEPLAVAMHGLNRGDVKENEMVLVVGAGPIGICIASLAKIRGARVIVMDIRPHRLEFANEHTQADLLISAGSLTAIEEIRTFSGNDMCQVVIDATGNLGAIQNGLNFLAPGGRYVLVGLQKDPFSFSHPLFHKLEASLLSSRNALKEEFREVIRLINTKQLSPAQIITHRVAFDQLPEQFESLQDPRQAVIKALIEI